MTEEEARKILRALFDVMEHVDLLHLSGGGEPFLNPNLPELIDLCFEYVNRFDRLMVFTNSTIPPKERLLEALERHKDKVIVHASNYGLRPEVSNKLYAELREHNIPLREICYHGDSQDYGGWVDFGSWSSYGRTEDELENVFRNCGITKHMHGNWRTRDGKAHWCQRSQRGMELGLIPNVDADYVDLLDESTSVEEKRAQFEKIEKAHYLSACDFCSGNHGTEDPSKRFPAGQQISEGVRA